MYVDMDVYMSIYADITGNLELFHLAILVSAGLVGTPGSLELFHLAVLL